MKRKNMRIIYGLFLLLALQIATADEHTVENGYHTQVIEAWKMMSIGAHYHEPILEGQPTNIDFACYVTPTQSSGVTDPPLADASAWMNIFWVKIDCNNDGRNEYEVYDTTAQHGFSGMGWRTIGTKAVYGSVPCTWASKGNYTNQPKIQCIGEMNGLYSNADVRAQYIFPTISVKAQAYCGNTACDSGETCTSCPADCGACSACTESWACSAWSACSSGSQTRTCTDSNSCGTTTTKPSESQACTASCTENWTCTAWNTCSSGSQTRTCTDTNRCGTTTSKPAVTQSCCLDNDGDGYGAGCTNGADCNDNNASIKPGATEICDGVDNDCDGTVDEGCTCENGQVKQCGTSDKGVCKLGSQTCTGSTWGTCVGNVEPIAEICGDGLDNDCDGTIDNGCEACVSEWDCKVEPEQCPTSGKQTRHCVDKKCHNEPTTAEISCSTQTAACNGCDYQGSCVFFGFRTQEGYCDVSKQFSPLKEDTNACNNNYECKSNVCSMNNCVNLQQEIAKSAGLLKKIWCKITNLLNEDNYQKCLVS